MILDTLDRIDLYANMHPRLREAFDQLKRKDLATLPVGRNTIKPYLHVDVVKGEMFPRENSKVEVHSHYIDIHVPLTGWEMVGWLDKGRCTKLIRAIPEKDAELFEFMCESWNELRPGYFALYFTGEGHAPMVGQGAIHKVVVKVALKD
jgi:biofilm protein TabA